MQKLCSPERYFSAHLPHRLTVMTAVLRHYRDDVRRNAEPDLFRAAKDASIIMMRMFCRAVGIEYGDAGLQWRKKASNDIKGVIRITPATTSRNRLSIADQQLLTKIMFAGHKAVGHMTDTPDHEVDEEVLMAAIPVVLRLVDWHIYTPNDRILDRSFAGLIERS